METSALTLDTLLLLVRKSCDIFKAHVFWLGERQQGDANFSCCLQSYPFSTTLIFKRYWKASYISADHPIWIHSHQQAAQLTDSFVCGHYGIKQHENKASIIRRHY